ncbi:MAG: hypothetical protein JWM87_3256 [Candidatus Eremiobacteraeota bacterium]|nr:hypothetical protein [Candidatus Eremiobacteraeota bacterium]
MRERERIATDPVACHEQPSRTSLFDEMLGIARRDLLGVEERGGNAPAHQPGEQCALVHTLVETVQRHSGNTSGDLAERTSARRIGFERGVGFHEAFASDRPDFDGITVAHRRNDGDHRVDQKIDVMPRAPVRFEPLARRKRDDLEVVSQIRLAGACQGIEQMISGTRSTVHRRAAFVKPKPSELAKGGTLTIPPRHPAVGTVSEVR